MVSKYKDIRPLPAGAQQGNAGVEASGKRRTGRAVEDSGRVYSEVRTELVDRHTRFGVEPAEGPALDLVVQRPERVTSRPDFIMIRWLPVWRTDAKPALPNAFAAPAPETTGRCAIAQTVTSSTVAPLARAARSLRVSMEPRIAS